MIKTAIIVHSYFLSYWQMIPLYCIHRIQIRLGTRVGKVRPRRHGNRVPRGGRQTTRFNDVCGEERAQAHSLATLPEGGGQCIYSGFRNIVVEMKTKKYKLT